MSGKIFLNTNIVVFDLPKIDGNWDAPGTHAEIAQALSEDGA